MEKILMIGQGLLGSKTKEKLIRDGYEVYFTSSRKSNAVHPNCFICDHYDHARFNQIVQGFDNFVIMIAPQYSHDPRPWKKTVELLIGCPNFKPKKIAFISSTRVYRDPNCDLAQAEELLKNLPGMPTVHLIRFGMLYSGFKPSILGVPVTSFEMASNSISTIMATNLMRINEYKILED